MAVVGQLAGRALHADHPERPRPPARTGTHSAEPSTSCSCRWPQASSAVERRGAGGRTGAQRSAGRRAGHRSCLVEHALGELQLPADAGLAGHLQEQRDVVVAEQLADGAQTGAQRLRLAVGHRQRPVQAVLDVVRRALRSTRSDLDVGRRWRAPERPRRAAAAPPARPAPPTQRQTGGQHDTAASTVDGVSPTTTPIGQRLGGEDRAMRRIEEPAATSVGTAGRAGRGAHAPFHRPVRWTRGGALNKRR